jgi:hypothetical protein
MNFRTALATTQKTIWSDPDEVIEYDNPYGLTPNVLLCAIKGMVSITHVSSNIGVLNMTIWSDPDGCSMNYSPT